MKQSAFTFGMLLILTGCTTTSCLTNLQPWPDPSGTHINLQQCWDKSDQIRFYTTNQGSQIAPYDLIKHLEMPLSGDKFFARANFERWRFLPLEQTDRDQDSDVDKDVQDWPLGFVINTTSSGKEAWHGKWLGLTCAGCHSGQIEYQTKKIRIDGAPTMANVTQFLWDLQAALKATYEDGLKNGDKFKRYAKNFPGEWDKALLERLGHVVTERAMWHDRNDPPTPPGFARLDAVGIIFNQLIYMSGNQPVGGFKTDAPVSFPFLWDTPHHNQTQWDGVAPVLPMVRNVVQGIGAFAKYNPDAGWFEDPSTISLSNQRTLQALVSKLRSPAWPRDILGPIDQKKAELGRVVFEQKCESCHASQKREAPLRNIRMEMTPVQKIKTDSNMVDNADHRQLQGKDGAKEFVHIAAKPASLDIVFSLNHVGDFFPFVGEVISAFVTWGSNFGKDEFGDRYKGRPLDGIWATAPYLHNGSVPNLYQLLVSAERKPFYVGSRQFDPKHVGFDPGDKSGTFLDTSIPGNLNTGHDSAIYGGDLDLDKEVWPLIEYMKTL
jgi:cytochrome c2